MIYMNKQIDVDW